MLSKLFRKRNGTGQSLVEMTMVMPFLLLLLMGLIEIGWYTGHYLVLLDATRESARFGVNRDPTDWPNPSSSANSACDPVSNPDPKFYVALSCYVIANMSPIEFDLSRDDIVVSVFSYGYDTVNQCAGLPECGSDPVNSCYGDLNGNSTCDAGDRILRRYPVDLPEGYSWNGKFTSSFTMGDINDRLEPGAPPSGLVLVELFWWHDQLLGLPLFNLFANPVLIHSWAMFPVSAAEPTPTPLP